MLSLAEDEMGFSSFLLMLSLAEQGLELLLAILDFSTIAGGGGGGVRWG